MAPAQNIIQTEEEALSDHLQEFFNDKRYLLVLDDIDMELWEWIKSTFRNNGTSSRIIVTTAINKTANFCSSFGDGYVYTMRTLEPAPSKQIALPDGNLEPFAGDLLDICDGLPLALVSVATHFRHQKSGSPRKLCTDLCRCLGSYLLGDVPSKDFARLGGVLMGNYTNLCNYTDPRCLLYLGIFPNGRPLKRDVIIRRWIAEGYARSDGPENSEMSVADDKFEEFINWNIIQPAGTRNNQVLKTGKAHGVVHEFLLSKSISEKFIMPSHAARHKNVVLDGKRYKKVRHISVHDGNNSISKDLSRVRSLTVQGNACSAISNLRKYKVIRVLDLEEYIGDVTDHRLKDICELWNLRYLSLGPNISELPKKIAKLKLLETLHVSKTRVTVLPMEVLGLPCLVYLIGRFNLGHQAGTMSSSDIEQLLKKSKLETLAGFVADGSQEFLKLMAHLKKLSKVKIWCEYTEDTTSTLNDHLLQAIQKYTGAPMDQGDDRSLSIDFQRLPERSMHALRDLYNHSLDPTKIYYLRSLKLKGDLSTLSECIGVFSDLEALCLSSSTVTQDLLSAINISIPTLLYLKLIVQHLENTVIEDGALPNLLCLRFVVTGDNPILPEIQDGALPKLESLQLHCEHISGLHGINISFLKKLREISLGGGVSDKARRAWEAEARNHRNRPAVLHFTKTSTPASIVATENPAAAVGQMASIPEVPEPSSAMQMELGNVPSSSSNILELRGEMDDPTQNEQTESPIAPPPMEAAAESPLQGVEGQTGQETDRSGQLDSLNSTTSSPSISEETYGNSTTGSEYRENHDAPDESAPQNGNGGVQEPLAEQSAVVECPENHAVPEEAAPENDNDIQEPLAKHRELEMECSPVPTEEMSSTPIRSGHTLAPPNPTELPVHARNGSMLPVNADRNGVHC